MDQARDPVTGRPAAAPVDTTQTSGSPEAIADDIRETRAELSDTISQIGDKLDPSHLVDGAKEALFSSARDAGTSMIDQVKSSSVLDTIKDNPLPAMAVGLSVAWFLSKIGETETDRYRAERYRATGDPYYAPRPRYATGYGDGRYLEDDYRGDRRPVRAFSSDDASLADKASDALDTAKDKVAGAVDAVTDKASDLGDRARDAASNVGDSASGAVNRIGDATPNVGRDDVQRYQRRATSWLDGQMQSNPLAVGAVALAAGALVGLSVPETDAEHRAFGQRAETARRELQSAAQGATQQVTAAAQEVANEAADKVESVGKEVEAKAKSVGADAKDRADSVAGTAKGDLEDVKDEVASEARSASTGASSADVSTGSSIDLSTAPVTPLAGTTEPPVDLATPSETVDLTDGSSSRT
ncbi:DUF3618 domain-containing protein [Rubrivirga sp.]|uniref:DUF3618 domain-containing protein n=1 Tax=Rubrivirga sp. TaxID=1885344 RepID=UPI003C786A5C